MDAELTFEAALAELEAIVASLEGEGLAMDAALDRYQRGLQLLQLCRGRLKDAEGRLKVLREQLETGAD